MDKINLVLLASRWLHLASAIVAVGGAAFMRFVLMPAAADALDDATHERLRESVRRRWAVVVHACISILLLTGTLNFVLIAVLPKIRPMPYHALFTIKVLAAIGIFFIASVLVSRGHGLAKMRIRRARWLTVLIFLGAFVVLVSGMLSQVRTSQIRAAAVTPSEPALP